MVEVKELDDTVRGVGAGGLGRAAVGAKATGGVLVHGRLEGSWLAELAASQFGSETMEAAWAEESPSRLLGEVNGGSRSGPLPG